MNKEFAKLNDKAEKHFSRKPDKITESAKWFRYVIRTYMYYAVRAALNGYPIKMRGFTMLALHREPERELNKKEKKRYFKSPRVFGHIFTLKFTGGPYTDDWTFYPAKKILVRAKGIMESDVIYKLIKP